jgi:hypothetical protein
MLCAKCSVLHFRRFYELPSSEAARIKRPDEESLYSFHHETLADLEVSQDKCHLCRKISDAFEGEIRSKRAEFPEFSPVYLRIFLKDEFIHRGEAKSLLASEIVEAYCAELSVAAWLAPPIQGICLPLSLCIASLC